MKTGLRLYLIACFTALLSGILVSMASNNQWGAATAMVLITFIITVFGAAHLINNKE